MVQRSQDIVNGYHMRGCDDWYVYVQDKDGNWGSLNTELAPQWERIPPTLRDTQGGVFLIGVLMLEDGRKPTLITDLEGQRELSKSYGDS